jgi:hypothetical protein
VTARYGIPSFANFVTAEGAAFAGRVLDHMRERLTRFQEETGHRQKQSGRHCCLTPPDSLDCR